MNGEVKKIIEDVKWSGAQELIAICAIIILIGIGLWYWYSLQPKRVCRAHTETISKEFENLTYRINLNFSGDTRFSKKEAENDLDELEWLL